MDKNNPIVTKIDNTFNRVMNEINKFEKVFQAGGNLEKAVMDIQGDVAWLKDIREALSDAYEALEEGHYGTLGHLDMNEQLSKKKKITPKTPVDMVAEGVLDGDDEDGFMARSQLYFMARDAIALHSMVKDQDDLAPWVQSKIAQASKDIDSVRRYTEYNAMKDAVQPEPEMEESAVVEGRLGFSDIEKFGDEACSKIDMECRRRGSADMEPGDADELRYKVAKEMGYLEEAKEEMCPDACCGKPVSECSCGPDCEHCDCYAENQQKMNEGMEFDEKRDSDLQVIAKDMFKNALANAKKKAK